MKAFLKKLKKTKLSIRLIYFFIVIISIGSYAYLLKSLLILKNIETTLRIIVLVVLGIIIFLYTIGDLLLLLTRKYKTVIVTSIILMIFSAVSLIGSKAINNIYSILTNMNKDKLIYTTKLITMKDTTFSNNSSFSVGIIKDPNEVDNILGHEIIEKEKLKIKLVEYDTTFELLDDLYNGKINGAFVTGDYMIMYESYEQYENIQSDVKVIYTHSKEMKDQDYIESTGNIEEPFTILIMGVDSTSDTLNASTSFNGDTIMLITFNPRTLNATVFSIPRDTYVPISCIKDSSKINSSAAYGTDCVINTVQDLVGIKIDYYVKINFKGVVDLVDALGGIDITVPDGIKFCEQNSKRSFEEKDLQCISSGFQHMNGEQALAFARHRKTLPTGDFQRVQHQQLVVESIANASKQLSSINDFTKTLNAISININTNMSSGEMLGLYNVFKDVILNANDGTLINIQKTYLTGYDLNMYVNNLRMNVYTFQYFEESLNEIKTALKENLELKEPTLIKTFNFSVNDTYEVPIIGQKYYQVQRKEVVPNFFGKNLEYVKSWCEARNITLNTTFVETTEHEANTITYQSVQEGKLVKDITSITVNVVKPNTTEEKPTNTKPNNSKPNDKPNSTKPNNKPNSNEKPNSSDEKPTNNPDETDNSNDDSNSDNNDDEVIEFPILPTSPTESEETE